MPAGPVGPRRKPRPSDIKSLRSVVLCVAAPQTLCGAGYGCVLRSTISGRSFVIPKCCRRVPRWT
eukprot:7236928-Pyramimonas_sp.AAC.1